MATYVAAYLYSTYEDPNTRKIKFFQQFDSQDQGILTNEDDDRDYFSTGETIWFADSTSPSQEYFGHTQYGPILKEYGYDHYYIYTNTPDIPEGAETDVFFGDFVVCFLPGTLIATPAGEVAVETLQAGDPVLTADGRTLPVRWLGRQTVSRRFARPEDVLPIRIGAGALGEGLPRRDLFVSPAHAILVDGMLVQAGALVDGTRITRHCEMPEVFVYYHVELGDHALLVAEGVPAESFVDNVGRRRFDNWREAPAAQAIAEMPLPRIKSARQLPQAIRRRLSRSAA